MINSKIFPNIWMKANKLRKESPYIRIITMIVRCLIKDKIRRLIKDKIVCKYLEHQINLNRQIINRYLDNN